MAKVRKISWMNKDGVRSHGFQLSYYDGDGHRHRSVFRLKSVADKERIRIENEMQDGTHVAVRFSKTVGEACESFIARKEQMETAKKIERSTVRRYRTHVEKHIKPHKISKVLLAKLRPMQMQDFADHLVMTKSNAMARKIWNTMRMVFKDARLHGAIVVDPCESVRLELPRDRGDNRITVPPKSEVKRLIEVADKDPTGRDGAMVCLMAFYGLRSSEVRGAARSLWKPMPDGSAELKIGQRADEYGKLGHPKSAKSRRTLTIGPDTAMRVKKAMLSRKPGPDDLIFPNEIGRPIELSKFLNRWFPRLMVKAGLGVRETENKNGEKLKRPHYELNFTPHQLRHVAASMRIEMGLQPKEIQEFMGHASLQMTMDTYGHLWRSQEKQLERAKEAERFFG